MRMLRDLVQHTLNPLHLFCRLKTLGLNNATARMLCARYERFLYAPIFS